MTNMERVFTDIRRNVGAVAVDAANAGMVTSYLQQLFGDEIAAERRRCADVVRKFCLKLVQIVVCILNATV